MVPVVTFSVIFQSLGNSFISASFLPSLLAIFQKHIQHRFWHPPPHTWVFNGLQLACYLVTTELMRAKMYSYHFKTPQVLPPKWCKYCISLFFFFFPLENRCRSTKERKKPIDPSYWQYLQNLPVFHLVIFCFPQAVLYRAPVSKPNLAWNNLKCDFYHSGENNNILL